MFLLQFYFILHAIKIKTASNTMIVIKMKFVCMEFVSLILATRMANAQSICYVKVGVVETVRDAMMMANA